MANEETLLKGKEVNDEGGFWSSARGNIASNTPILMGLHSCNGISS